MSEAELKTLLLSVSEIYLSLAEVRDDYLRVQGGEPRFMQLAEACDNLMAIEQALFEYREIKAPLFGKKPDREFLMVAVAALANGRVLRDVCKGELAMFYQIYS